MILDILFTIVGIFALVYLESLLLALFGFRVFVIIFFFLSRIIDWKPFFLVSAIILLIFDVIYKVPLGSNILILVLPFGFFLFLSMFVSLDRGVLSIFVKTLVFFLYYILLVLLPNLFVVGEFGFLTFNNLLSSLLRAVLSALVLLLLEYLYTGFRKRGNNSQIRLK